MAGERPEAAAGDTTAPRWLDDHLLLNAVAVLRHRINTDTGRAAALVDVLGGYLGAALLLDRSRSVASVDHFREWAECLVAMTQLADPEPHGLALHVETEDTPAVLDVSRLERPCSLLLGEARRRAPAPFASVELRVKPGGAKFLLPASCASLVESLRSLPGARTEPDAGAPGDDAGMSGPISVAFDLPRAGASAPG